MIRGFFEETPDLDKVVKQYKQFKDEWHISPYIEEAFGKSLTEKLA